MWVLTQSFPLTTYFDYKSERRWSWHLSDRARPRRGLGCTVLAGKISKPISRILPWQDYKTCIIAFVYTRYLSRLSLSSIASYFFVFSHSLESHQLSFLMKWTISRELFQWNSLVHSFSVGGIEYLSVVQVFRDDVDKIAIFMVEIWTYEEESGVDGTLAKRGIFASKTARLLQ